LFGIWPLNLGICQNALIYIAQTGAVSAPPQRSKAKFQISLKAQELLDLRFGN
jgi:hypothetical protein